MMHFNNCEYRMHVQNYKLVLILIGFSIIFQDVHVITTEAAPQNSQPGSLFGFLRAPSIVSNIVQGAEEAVSNLLPGPLSAQQTSSTATTPTTKRTQPIRDTQERTTSLPATTQGFDLFQFLRNQFQPNTTTTTISTKTTPSPTVKTKSLDLLGGISNIISDAINPFNIFKPPNISNKILVTTAAPNPIGSLFNGIGGLLGFTQTTTTTTLFPPPRGGRGFSGVVYNIVNIIADFVDILSDLLLVNDDWVPGYLTLKLTDMYESIKAEINIFLQSDQPGGLGEIWKSLSGIWNDLTQIYKTATSGNIVGMIGLPLLAGKTVQDIGNLNAEFALNFPTITFAPGVKHQPSQSVNLNEKEFQSVLNHTESLVENVLHIEDIVQKEFPNSTILQILGHIRKSFTTALEDSKKTGKPIIMDTVETMFPNDLLDTYIADFGKFLSEIFQNFPPIQTIGKLLQQKFIVNIVLSIIEAFINPFFENIEKFIEQIIKNIASRYLNLDPDHFLEHLIETLNNRVVDFGNYLQVSGNLLDKINLNFTEGDLLQQIRNITLNITNSNDTQEFVRRTIGEILQLIPFDFGEDVIHGITSVVTDAITMFMRLLSRILETVFPQSPTLTLNNVTSINSNFEKL